ncbi:MAG: hypothetical protein IJI43_00095 [Bacilli bacterium]|nr:hypothetical protein [Bacilli bacterium]
MKSIDKFILCALDAQRIAVSNYSIIMNKLDSQDKKLEFLNYLNKNRSVILREKDIFLKLKEITG